ncbi:MAG TPA: type II toxin-antitoxin system VapC family toxin [Candidatus Saccharimonadales bacterium]|nr:type II toxin-antitoxin system VapC family toxin [Candidatus Saccharimonadales bacterium]
MICVIDASLALCWFFHDEQTTASMNVLDQVSDNGAVVPALWRLEVANAFQVSIKRRRINHAYRDSSLTRLQALPIEVDSETDAQAWESTLRIADRFQLTLYDAAYLELALRRHLPIATRDDKLAEAARLASVAVIPTA